uniref:F-box associated domain-containing protein n=1 Tax=Lactuca sativa TaxID=4236 RepID=A0A9R1WA68_LACSA|nr:hypothetical protein LSAT_V11C200054790 [Lactuca sativa]
MPSDLLSLGTVLGFGVCPTTNDPTIVKITDVCNDFGTEVRSPIVEVFKLSRGSWRIPCSNLPKKSIQVTLSHIAIHSYIYWLGFDINVSTNGFETQKNLIISFDMNTEEFRVVDLPDSTRYTGHTMIANHKALKFVQYGLWIMLFRILGFTKNGKLIMETQDDYYIEGVDLAFYEPNLEHINDIGINGKDGSLFVSSYKETLLLLDKLDCSVLF